MKTPKIKVLEFIFQENEIHFCINGNDNDVMINATEMAKTFGKRTKDYLRLKQTKDFIEVLKQTQMCVQIIDDRGRNGIYFCRVLALKFAAWMDSEFEVWVYSRIDEITFGEYKKHWEAHARQQEAKEKMKILKEKMLTSPDQETIIKYFEAENEFNSAAKEKNKAIRNQLKLFNNENGQ